MLIGVAWGTTLAAIVQHLVPHETRGSTVVQTNGSANHSTSGIPYVGAIISTVADAFGCQVVHFPVPAFFDYASTKDAMWRERMVTRVLGLQARLDLVIFGVGALEGPLKSHVYASGYLDEADVQQITEQRVVGDVCTVLLRKDGSWRDIPLNARASGITPAQLQTVPRRICVASGQAKRCRCWCVAGKGGHRPGGGRADAGPCWSDVIDRPAPATGAGRSGQAVRCQSSEV